MNKIIYKIFILIFLVACNPNIPVGGLDVENGIAYKAGSKQADTLRIPYNGPYEAYSGHGKLQEKSYYIDGKLNGLKETYHSNGETFTKENYLDGKRDGEYYTYHENGKLKSSDTYKNGKLNGTSFKFDTNGITILTITIYKNDNMVDYCGLKCMGIY